MATAAVEAFSEYTSRNGEVDLQNGRNNFLSDTELDFHIRGCAENNRVSQKKLYESFFGYAMSICDRYSNNYEDSLEILNDGFLKIFKEIHRYKSAYTSVSGSFKGWVRKIIIYTAIDHFRRNYKRRLTRNIESEELYIPSTTEDVFDRISYDEIKSSIQELTPSYRLAFNLAVIEGYSHEEISKQLGITIGASKSNLARGRKQLQKKLFRKYHITLSERMSRVDL